MNRQFTEMGSKLAAKLDPTSATFSDYLKSPNPASLFLQKIMESEIGRLIQELDTNKSVGVDEIPPKVLKWGAKIFIPLLTKLFNMCINEGIYPDSLKLARVIPVFKDGNRNDSI